MEETVETVDPLIGAQIAGKLRVEALIGAGSTGRVYRARHTGLDRPVAIKILSVNAVIRNPVSLERFRLEARAASRVDHPNVVRVLDFGEDAPGECWYIVMELVEGEDLRLLLDREGPLPPERAKRIVAQTLDALAAAHAAGIVHRDVKPRNILCLAPRAGHDEQIKVCDFGLAKILERSEPGPAGAELTRAGTTPGTPAFMAPEQVRGAKVDERTDVYAAGALLFQLLTGEIPFAASDRRELFERILHEPPPSPSSRNARVDGSLDALVKRALEKAPEHRFQSAREMRDALFAQPGEAPVVRVRSGLERIRRERAGARRIGWALIVGLGALTAALVVAGLAVRAPTPKEIAPRSTLEERAPSAVLGESSPATLAAPPSEEPEEALDDAARAESEEPIQEAVAVVPSPSEPSAPLRERPRSGPRVTLERIKAPSAVEARLRQIFATQAPSIERCLSQATTDADGGALIVALRATGDHFELLGVRDQLPGSTAPARRDSERFVSSMRSCLAPVFAGLEPPPSPEALNDVRAAFRFRPLSPR